MPNDDWNDESRALLRLANVRAVGSARAKKLLEAFGSATAAFGEGPGMLAAAGAHDIAEALRSGVDERAVERALRWQEASGQHLIALNSARYPGLLRQIHDPPLVLYARGRADLLQGPAVAIVGSRNATAQGKSDAYALAHALSEAGVCVVSGMALGIDASAHAGALAGRASSVAVLGTGIDRVYPHTNRHLDRQLEREGCLVTELPLGTAPHKGNFPVRNRLISGLSRGVLVIEAAMESGSLVTARCALDQSRDVFAMPGSIHSPLSKGCHWLIREGAKLTQSAHDVLVELGMETAAPRGAPEAEVVRRESLLDFMGFAPISLEQLAARSRLGVARTAEQLSRLELDGDVAILAGGLFQRTPRTSARQ